MPPLRPLGLVPSKPDPRDYQHPTHATMAIALPASYMVPNQEPIRDQGQTSTCVGQAIATLMGVAMRAKGITRTLSAMAVYLGARSLEHPAPPEGTSLRDGLLYAQQGVCFDADFPMGAAGPGANAATDAQLSRAGGFAVVDTSNPLNIKAALVANQNNLAAALEVTPGFDSPDANGVAQPGGPSRGSHAINIIGYDDARQAFRVRNSWSTAWAQQGYCWWPYRVAFSEVYSATVVALDRLPAPAPKPWWAWFFGG